MDPAMHTALNTLKFDSRSFQNGIATLDDETACQTVVDNTNPILWLTGHLLNSRKYLLDLFGDPIELDSETKFREKYDPSAQYPSMSELSQAWASISDKFLEKMEQASDDHFIKEIDWDLPNNDKTVRGAFLFYVYHEAWHLGQIAHAREGLGMEGLVPY